MRGHNIWFPSEIRKIIIKYSLLSKALSLVKLYTLIQKLSSIQGSDKLHVLTRKSVHRTRMPPPNAIQKKGTHCINVMHAPVKFHEYIPYSLGVMARTRLTIWNLVKGK